MEKIKIDKTEYNIVDSKEKITVADSFVKPSNKIMTGNGEAKLYLGNDNPETRGFFGPKGFRLKCFILKKDLRTYLKDSEAEYKNPQQAYRHKEQMPQFWNERYNDVSSLNDVLWFDLAEQSQIQGSRVYAKSKDVAFEMIREISLPFITYISIIKLEDSKGEIIFYFRLFVDYFGEVEHPFIILEEEIKIEEEPISTEKKLQLTAARVGQGKYRENLLKECPLCPITMVSDDRLLIASHIKPWAKSNDKEKTDSKNGFMLTPTFDFLFDRGFITFSNDKNMKLSPWISKVTYSKLNISDNKKYPMLPVEGRETYLEYHRQNIFKGLSAQ